MVSEVQAIGFFLLVYGLPGAVWPHRVAKLGEQLQSIGRKGPFSEVEPTDWNVGLTRVLGILATITGTLWVLFGG
jgi:hypothetical protein